MIKFGDECILLRVYVNFCKFRNYDYLNCVFNFILCLFIICCFCLVIFGCIVEINFCFLY